MMKKALLKDQLKALGQRIDARPQRERIMMCVAAAALGFLMIDSVALTPALRAWKAANVKQQKAEGDIDRLKTEANRVATEYANRQRQLQAELQSWRARVREGETALRQHEAALVGPDQMLSLLEHMLARHGQLKVRSMTSLGRVDLLAPTGAAGAPSGPTPGSLTAALVAINPGNGASGPAASSAAVSASAPTGAPPSAASAAAAAQAAQAASDAAHMTLYRHGVEMTVEGGYAELLAYLQALESMPQRVLWGNVSFKVEQYPKAALTLQLYTISRDRQWLEI